MVNVTIDGVKVDAKPGSTILEASRSAEIYIPALCSHPDLPSSKGTKLSDSVYHGEKLIKGSVPENLEFEGCKLCIVEIEGRDEPVTSCNIEVEEGMVILTSTPKIKEQRQLNLIPILAVHPHVCLTCAQVEGCSREPCSANVPMIERCCPLLGNCELQKVAEYIGVKDETPRYVPQNLPIIKEEPMFTRDYNLCIACSRCVRVCRDVRGVDALAITHDGKRFVVGTRAPTLKGSECRFCGACVEVCPTGALVDKDLKEKTEAALVPCRAACPAGKDIPRFLRLVAEGKYSDAVSVMTDSAPLMCSLGNICFGPCEDSCNRAKVNEPIAITALERFAVSKCFNSLRTEKAIDRTSKRVAIVGSGPAGLTCAYYLSGKGYNVTVYEAMPEPGGMLRYGIPEYRLPPESLQKDIAFMLSKGFELKLNVRIGEDITLENLKNEHDAVFLAVGSQLSKKLNVEGIDLDGVLWGLDFLRDVRSGKDIKLDGRVVVIGGGNVAIDVALTALRLGAEDVQLACLETVDEMPAFKWEIEEALKEGVGIHNSWGPKKIKGEEGRAKAVELMRCTSVFDENGKFNPKYDPDTTKILEAENVILAIGQSSDLRFLGKASLETAGGLLRVDKNTFATSVGGIFAGGEVVSGPASVIESIANGKKAASSIDKHLGGDGKIDGVRLQPEKPKPWLGREEGFAARKRPEMAALPLEERKSCFKDIELGFDEVTARSEATRCLQCDLRLYFSPITLPPEKWIEFNADNVEQAPAADGVLILLDETKNVIYIAGTQNMREGLKEQLKSADKARYFGFEGDKMYTKRESELLQQHLQKHGKLPELNDELEDLF